LAVWSGQFALECKVSDGPSFYTEWLIVSPNETSIGYHNSAIRASRDRRLADRWSLVVNHCCRILTFYHLQGLVVSTTMHAGGFAGPAGEIRMLVVGRIFRALGFPVPGLTVNHFLILQTYVETLI